jgi:hypothetical protein
MRFLKKQSNPTPTCAFSKRLIYKETTRGGVDYLVAVRREMPAVPFLCVAEAKKDDFAQGTAQCLVEMQACCESNAAKNIAFSCVWHRDQRGNVVFLSVRQ